MSASFDSILVVGDSVAGGGGAEDGGWPAMLAERLDLPAEAVRVDARTARTMVHVRDHLEEILESAGERPLVLVQAGHNDPQDGEEGPRVTESAFATAAREVDRALAANPDVAAHAVVAPVPLVALERPDAVPISEAAARRSRRYEERLRRTVEPYVALGGTPPEWAELIADGVHPTPAGHEAVADRVAAWVRGR